MTVDFAIFTLPLLQIPNITENYHPEIDQLEPENFCFWKRKKSFFGKALSFHGSTQKIRGNLHFFV